MSLIVLIYWIIQYLGITQGTGMAGVMSFSPNQIPEQEKGLWFRPYATFENVGLSGGPNVKNIGYGSLFGGDSELIELKRGAKLGTKFAPLLVYFL